MGSKGFRYPPPHTARHGATTIRTTIYELLEAIGEAAEPGEDQLVIKTMQRLLDKRRIKFSGKTRNA